ncbi:unnamed protein product [Adineta ricciae]|uniref:Apple domain-containing protein n=1 Tax=Adineta ricciae TaxID=249248 RepID=A0A814QEW9_ADIRI|nr:unnamed protein product [Adineta ricciae]CAF1118656.1 unnamed protein product [Adineta ricciae]
MDYSLFVLVANLIMSVGLSLSNVPSRTSSGMLFPRKRFIPSEESFYLGMNKARNRLRCINSCQEASSCQTVTYDQITQECWLFSEHIAYGFGRLVDDDNKHLMTIRLDKDSHAMQTKLKEQLSVTISSLKRKPSDVNVCENCEL